MVNMTFAVPEDLHKEMRKHNEIKWSAVCREAINMKLKQLELTKKPSTKEMQEARKVMDRIRAETKNWNSTTEIRKWRETRYSS